MEANYGSVTVTLANVVLMCAGEALTTLVLSAVVKAVLLAQVSTKLRTKKKRYFDFPLEYLFNLALLLVLFAIFKFFVLTCAFDT